MRARPPSASSTAAGGSRIRSVPEDAPFSPSEIQFFESLRNFRNVSCSWRLFHLSPFATVCCFVQYYFVSRVEPLQHHFECHFEIHEVKLGHKPSARQAHAAILGAHQQSTCYQCKCIWYLMCAISFIWPSFGLYFVDVLEVALMGLMQYWNLRACLWKLLRYLCTDS